MDRFIGLDVHASSCTFAVVGPSGRRLAQQVVETNGQALVGFLKTVPGTLHLCFEECTQSNWLTEILRPHVSELVVAGVGKMPFGPKSDQKDAFSLADRLRKRDIHPVVYKQQGAFSLLRQLVKVHLQVGQDVVRVQNRLRALFRSRGIQASKKIYSAKHRGDYLAQLPTSTRLAAEHLYAHYDALCPVKKEAEKALVEELHRHAISRVLETCPGFGPIRVAQVMATVVSPYRFRKRQQFWSYCGLGIVMRSSADWEQLPNGSWQRVHRQATRGLNRNHNHLLKAVFKNAATTVLYQHSVDEPLRRITMQKMEAGMKPTLARVTLARKLATTILCMWREGQPYDSKRVQREASSD